MIPTIGLMIAPYMIVKLLSIATNSGAPPNTFVKTMAVLSVLWIGLCAIGLIMESASAPSFPPVH